MCTSSQVVRVMTNTTIRFSDVTFGFRAQEPLFEGVSCTIASTPDAGKIVAVMGPSGVGKSTFCDLALGLRKPQQGSITFEPAKANIAVIPQKAVLFDELSIEENISCLKYSNTLGMTFDEQRLKLAVEALGLTTVLKRRTGISALSGGEAQRVMLARIQSVACDVLILDEPCSFLDNRVKDSFLEALRLTVDQSRLLALMVTHVWDEAQRIADEVIFFNQASGKPVTIHRREIREARRYPPTVDALYAIHWPDCLTFDLKAKNPVPDISLEDVPVDARFMGLYKGICGQEGGPTWACDLWHQSKRSILVNGGCSDAVAERSVNEGLIVVAYYNGDGVLV